MAGTAAPLWTEGPFALLAGGGFDGQGSTLRAPWAGPLLSGGECGKEGRKRREKGGKVWLLSRSVEGKHLIWGASEGPASPPSPKPSGARHDMLATVDKRASDREARVGRSREGPCK